MLSRTVIFGSHFQQSTLFIAHTNWFCPRLVVLKVWGKVNCYPLYRKPTPCQKKAEWSECLSTVCKNDTTLSSSMFISCKWKGRGSVSLHICSGLCYVSGIFIWIQIKAFSLPKKLSWQISSIITSLKITEKRQNDDIITS